MRASMTEGAGNSPSHRLGGTAASTRVRLADPVLFVQPSKRQRVGVADSPSVGKAKAFVGEIANTAYGGPPEVGAPYSASSRSPVTSVGQL